MTPSGDSAKAIQFCKKLIQNSSLVEVGMHRADPGDSEVSERFAHHARRPKALGSTKAALGLSLRAHRFGGGI
jgi:hypothetical protein